MNIEQIKKIIPTCTEKLKLVDLKIYNMSGKSYLHYTTEPKDILVRIDGIDQFQSLNMIDYLSCKYDSFFIKAEKIMFIENDLFVFYELLGYKILNFDTNEFRNLTLIKRLQLFRDYSNIIFLLMLVKEDFKRFDSKLFYYKEAFGNADYIEIKYLFNGKLMI